MGSERRDHRFPVPGVRLKGPAFDAPVVNLSGNGLAIVSDRPLEQGDGYAAWLTTEADRSWVEGRVVHCNPRKTPGGATTSVFDIGLSVTRVGKGPASKPTAEEEPEALSSGQRNAPRVKAPGMTFRSAGFEAEVTDFSSRGLGLKVPRELIAGEAYDGELATVEGAVHLRAIVVWCDRAGGAAGGTEAYVAGMRLSKVDQRIRRRVESDVAVEETVAPPAEAAAVDAAVDAPLVSSDEGELAEPEMTEPEIADPEVAQPEIADPEIAEPEIADDLPPWMTEIADDSTLDGASAHRRWRWLAVVLGLTVVIAGVMLWPGDEGGDSSQVVPEQPPAVSAPTVADTVEPRPATEPQPGELDSVSPGSSGSSNPESSGSAPTEPESAQADSVEAEAGTLGQSLSDQGADQGGDQEGEQGVVAWVADPDSVLGQVVLRGDVNVRSGPGLEFAIARRTADGERHSFVDQRGEWLRLATSDVEWVHRVTLQEIVEAQ